MHRTKIDIPDGTRTKLTKLLGQRLADALDLESQCKQAHWNVRGPSFYSMHLLFDKIAEDAEDYVDLIAERMAQLGGQPHGTIRAAAKTTSLPEYPLDASDGMDHIEALSTALAAFGNKVREDIGTTDPLDKGTSDMFTEISRGTDSWLWMVEAHLKNGR